MIFLEIGDGVFHSLFPEMPDQFWPAMRHVLWRVDPEDALSIGYSTLNVVEAIAWFAVAVWVLVRLKRRKPVGGALGLSGAAWCRIYALAFVVFGLSDVMESQVVPVWLVAAKGVIFAAIVGIRFVVVRKCYPGAKM